MMNQGIYSIGAQPNQPYAQTYGLASGGQVPGYFLGGLLKKIGAIGSGILGMSLLGPVGAGLASGMFTGLTEKDLKKGILSGLTSYVGGKALDSLGKSALSSAQGSAMADAGSKAAAAASMPQSVGVTDTLKHLGTRRGLDAVGSSLISPENVAFVYPQMSNTMTAIDQDSNPGFYDPYEDELAASRSRYRRRFGQSPWSNLYAQRMGVVGRAEGGTVSEGPDADIDSIFRPFHVPVGVFGDPDANIDDIFDPEISFPPPGDPGYVRPTPPPPDPPIGGPGVPPGNPDDDIDDLIPPGSYPGHVNVPGGPDDTPGGGAIEFSRAQNEIPEWFTPGFMPELNYFSRYGNTQHPSMEDMTSRAVGHNPFDTGYIDNMLDIDSLLASIDDMTYAEGGEVQQGDQLVQAAIGVLTGQIEEGKDQIIQAFIEAYGVEAFNALREQLLQSMSPGATTQGMVPGSGGGMSDNIMTDVGGGGKVALSPGEFIVPADVVSMLGDGDSESGAKELEAMMARVRKAKTGRASQAKPLKKGGIFPG